jgi:myo-inositol 2-dehydrogenase / D-chiro-inositol 1-dehydrogenase
VVLGCEPERWRGLMDLDWHGIAFCYWFLGRPAIQSAYCQVGTYVHGEKTQGDDEAFCILELEGGAAR